MSEHHFKDKASAFAWYVEQCGQRAKSSFYANIPSEGRRVSRFAVSEMLRKERSDSGSSTDRASRKEEADIRKAEAEARIKERQDEREAREMAAEWVLREQSEKESCLWTARLRDAAAYHLSKAGPAIIHTCGASPARLAEVQALIEGALAAACNEIASSGEITAEFGEEEEGTC